MPLVLRTPLCKLFCYLYNVKVEDMIHDFDHYATIQEFFTRKVKERDIPQNPNFLLSPADSKVLSIRPVQSNDVYMIKGKNYSLCEFYKGDPNCQFSDSEIQKLFKREEEGEASKTNTNNSDLSSKKETVIYSVIFYLAPGDYHRFHSPAELVLTGGRHIPGALKSVSKLALRYLKKVYEKNERVLIDGEWKHGKMTLGFIGAMNVGSIVLNFDKSLHTNSFSSSTKLHKAIKKDYKGVHLAMGEEVGRFNFGSSVLMLVEVPKAFEFNIKDGDTVRYGDVIGQVVEEQ